MSELPPIVIRSSKRKGKRYIIELESGEKLKIGEEVVFRHGLFGGKTFDVDQWLAIMTEAWEHECYGKLLGMIARRLHTETEIRLKLFKKGFNRDTVTTTIDKANEVGLINDGRFAELFVDEKLTGGRQGRHKVTAELRKRGVSRDLIEAAFELYARTHGVDSEWENTLTMARRKWHSLAREEDIRKRRHKLLAFLANRGFDRDQAYRIIEACENELD